MRFVQRLPAGDRFIEVGETVEYEAFVDVPVLDAETGEPALGSDGLPVTKRVLQTIGIAYQAMAEVLTEDERNSIGIFSASDAEPDPTANFIPVPLLRQRIEALGMWDEFAAYLAQNPAEMLKVLTVEVGVDPAYPALTTAFDLMDVPQVARDIILAPPSAGVGVP